MAHFCHIHLHAYHMRHMFCIGLKLQDDFKIIRSKHKSKVPKASNDFLISKRRPVEFVSLSAGCWFYWNYWWIYWLILFNSRFYNPGNPRPLYRKRWIQTPYQKPSSTCDDTLFKLSEAVQRAAMKASKKSAVEAGKSVQHKSSMSIHFALHLFLEIKLHRNCQLWKISKDRM